MRKKYILFDFDGTLLNTNDVIVASWQATYDHYLGYVPPRKEIESSFGETLMSTIARFFEGHKAEDVRDYYRAYQDAHCDGMVYVYDDIVTLLDILRNRGYKIGIATSRTTTSMMMYLVEHKIDGYIDDFVTMDDVKKHKPHPDKILKLLEKFGAKPEEAIMLGDTKYDIGCAMNAGVESVLVGWSHYIDEEQMKEEGYEPTYKIDSPLDLLSLV